MLRDGCPQPVISLGVAAGGTIASATINVRVSCLTEFGETLASDRKQINIGADAKAVVVTLGRVPQARGYRIYASTNPAAEVWQGDLRAFTDATGTYTFSNAPATVGTALPTVDTGTLYASAEGYSAALAAAVEHYSELWPLRAELELAPGSTKYDLPDDWVDGFSAVLGVRDDVDANTPPRRYYPPAVRIVGTVAGQQQLVFGSALRGTDVKLEYTLPHTLDETTNTVPARHHEALALLGASYVAVEVAARYAHTGARQVSADTVAYEDRPRLFGDAPDSEAGWAGLARQFRLQAYRLLGCSQTGMRPATAVAEWALPPGGGLCGWPEC